MAARLDIRPVTPYRVDLRRLRLALVEAGIPSVAALGRILGVSRTTISQWANGVVPPNDKQIEMAKLLNLDPVDIWMPVV